MNYCNAPISFERMRKVGAMTIILVLTSLVVTAQDSTKRKVVKVLPVPAFGYAPETNWYVGAVGLFTIDPHQNEQTRVSNAKIEFNYTWKHQSITTVAWNYFTDQEAYINRTNLAYMVYPDSYFGIGPHTDTAGRIQFNSRRTLLETELLKNVGNARFWGIGLRFQKYAMVDNQDSILYTELVDSRYFGLSQILLQDTRDNLLNSKRGGMYQLILIQNVGSYGWYHTVQTDFRKYRSYFDDRLTVAARILAEANFGTLPFYDMAILGGDQSVRGYFYGRFRDQYMATMQVESRYYIGWRMGLAAFGGMSNLGNFHTSISQAGLKWNYGLGLRILADKKENINFRLDYALGDDGSSGFYIAFGESF